MPRTPVAVRGVSQGVEVRDGRRRGGNPERSKATMSACAVLSTRPAVVSTNDVSGGRHRKAGRAARWRWRRVAPTTSMSGLPTRRCCAHDFSRI